MGRGIANRQKKVVAPKRVWVKPAKASPVSPRERDGTRGRPKPGGKSKELRNQRPHPNPLPEGEGTEAEQQIEFSVESRARTLTRPTAAET